MRYLHRDKDGAVLGHYANRESYTEAEPVADDHPDLVAWKKKRQEEIRAYQERKAQLNPERLLGLINDLQTEVKKLKKG